MFSCDKCNKTFAHKSTLTAHMKNVHPSSLCFMCHKQFDSMDLVREHLIHHANKRSEFVLQSTTMARAKEVFRRIYKEGTKRLEIALSFDIASEIAHQCLLILSHHGAIQPHLGLHIK